MRRSSSRCRHGICVPFMIEGDELIYPRPERWKNENRRPRFLYCSRAPWCLCPAAGYLVRQLCVEGYTSQDRSGNVDRAIIGRASAESASSQEPRPGRSRSTLGAHRQRFEGAARRHATGISVRPNSGFSRLERDQFSEIRIHGLTISARSPAEYDKHILDAGGFHGSESTAATPAW